MLVAKVFRLLATLVSFGYYDDEKDVKGLIPIVIHFLDGTHDQASSHLQEKHKMDKRKAIMRIYYLIVTYTSSIVNNFLQK